MSEIERLVEALKQRGFDDITAEQAEAVAVRVAGSVEAYLAQLGANDAAVAEYKPLEGEEVPEKFADPVAYTVVPPAGS